MHDLLCVCVLGLLFGAEVMSIQYDHMIALCVGVCVFFVTLSSDCLMCYVTLYYFYQ